MTLFPSSDERILRHLPSSRCFFNRAQLGWWLHTPLPNDGKKHWLYEIFVFFRNFKKLSKSRDKWCCDVMASFSGPQYSVTCPWQNRKGQKFFTLQEGFS